MVHYWEELITAHRGMPPTPEAPIFKEFTDLLLRGYKSYGTDAQEQFYKRHTIWRFQKPPLEGKELE